MNSSNDAADARKRKRSRLFLYGVPLLGLLGVGGFVGFSELSNYLTVREYSQAIDPASKPLPPAPFKPAPSTRHVVDSPMVAYLRPLLIESYYNDPEREAKFDGDASQVLEAGVWLMDREPTSELRSSFEPDLHLELARRALSENEDPRVRVAAAHIITAATTGSEVNASLDVAWQSAVSADDPKLKPLLQLLIARRVCDATDSGRHTKDVYPQSWSWAHRSWQEASIDVALDAKLRPGNRDVFFSLVRRPSDHEWKINPTAPLKKKIDAAQGLDAWQRAALLAMIAETDFINSQIGEARKNPEAVHYNYELEVLSPNAPVAAALRELWRMDGSVSGVALELITHSRRLGWQGEESPRAWFDRAAALSPDAALPWFIYLWNCRRAVNAEQSIADEPQSLALAAAATKQFDTAIPSVFFQYLRSSRNPDIAGLLQREELYRVAQDTVSGYLAASRSPSETRRLHTRSMMYAYLAKNWPDAIAAYKHVEGSPAEDEMNRYGRPSQAMLAEVRAKASPEIGRLAVAMDLLRRGHPDAAVSNARAALLEMKPDDPSRPFAERMMADILFQQKWDAGEAIDLLDKDLTRLWVRKRGKPVPIQNGALRVEAADLPFDLLLDVLAGKEFAIAGKLALHPEPGKPTAEVGLMVNALSDEDLTLSIPSLLISLSSDAEASLTVRSGKQVVALGPAGVVDFELRRYGDEVDFTVNGKKVLQGVDCFGQLVRSEGRFGFSVDRRARSTGGIELTALSIRRSS